MSDLPTYRQAVAEADMRPAVRGGQGRTDQSVIDDGSAIAGIVIGACLVLAFYGVGLLIAGNVAAGTAFACLIPTGLGLARIMEWIG